MKVMTILLRDCAGKIHFEQCQQIDQFFFLYGVLYWGEQTTGSQLVAEGFKPDTYNYIRDYGNTINYSL